MTLLLYCIDSNSSNNSLSTLIYFVNTQPSHGLSSFPASFLHPRFRIKIKYILSREFILKFK